MDEDAPDPLAFALTARPERIEAALLALAPALAPHVVDARQTLAALALGLAPEAPPAALRLRLLATLRPTAPPRRGVLVIDMIRDHLAPGSALEVPRARAVVPALRRRLAEARRAGVPVIYVLDAHDPDDTDLDAWGAHAVRGSEGARVWDAIAPEPGDHLVEKPTFSAFHASGLEATLSELGLDTLELTGCLTEMGLFATATDALQRGFAVEVPPATQAGAAPELERAALTVLAAMAPYGPARQARLAATEARRREEPAREACG